MCCATVLCGCNCKWLQACCIRCGSRGTRSRACRAVGDAADRPVAVRSTALGVFARGLGSVEQAGERKTHISLYPKGCYPYTYR